MRITHLGGEHTVTGSCHLVQARGLSILVDCGLAQGSDAVPSMDTWPAAPADIDFLFLTHAHIDHIGRVPELIRRGFAGEIIASHPTRALLFPMLEDAMGFADMGKKDVKKISRKIHEAAWGFEYSQAFDLPGGIRFTLGRAGHILGSCWVQLDIPQAGRMVFSGDLGNQDAPILCDPDVPDGCDLLILESTYGDRRHGDRKDRTKRLGAVLKRALKDGGKVFVPAFALGRTQELIYEMDRLFDRGLDKVPVFVDTPLGLEVTEIYSNLSQYWDKEAKRISARGDHPIDFKGLYAVRRHAEHQALCEQDGPMVVLAGSGMCTGGRIIDHLRSGIEGSKNDVVFVGYQAAGTPGRDILTHAGRPGGYVLLDGQKRRIRAAVHQLSGYSAHADQPALVAWVAAMTQKPKKIKLVHGEKGPKQTLQKALEKALKKTSSTPRS